MTKINEIQNAILELDGGTYQKMMDSYLYRKFGFPNIFSLGSQAGTNKSTKGTPDSYVRLENGKYVFIMYGTVQVAAHLKIKDDILSCLNEGKTKIGINEIERIICCFTSTNITPAQNKELLSLFENVLLIGISEISQDLYYKYQILAKDYLCINIDTDQIVTSDEFVRKCGESVFATSLDMTLFGRENEKRDLLLLLSKRDVVLIFGKSGAGKTRLALEVAKEFAIKNDYEFKCIKQNGESLYEDIKAHFSDNKNYIILIDDANQLAHLGHLLDMCVDSSRVHKVKLLLTVRDYAKEKTVIKIGEKVQFEFYELSLLNQDEITKILKGNLGINNMHYLEKINEISNGNIRLAIIAGNCSKKGSLENIKNIFDVYNLYFKDIIYMMSKKEIIVASLIAFFDSIKLDGEHMVYILAGKHSISPNEFSELCGELNQKEVVNLYHDMAVKFDEQNLGNYLQYYVFFKEKWLLPSEIIVSAFPEYRGRVTYSFSTILSLFFSEEIAAFMRAEAKKAWDTFKNNNQQKKLEFIESFSALIEEEALHFLKNEIDISPETYTDFLHFDFSKGSNYHNITSKNIIILCKFKHSNSFSDALDLIIYSIQKNTEQPMDFYFAFKDYLSIDRHSFLENYSQEIMVVDKLLDAFLVSGRMEIAVILIQFTEEILKFQFQKFEEKRGNAISIVQFEIAFCDGSIALRNRCIKALIKLYSCQELQTMILRSLLHFQFFDPSPETLKILAFDISLFDEFAKEQWNSSKLDECIVMHHLFSVCKKYEECIFVEMLKYKENNKFLQYLNICQDAKETPKDWIERKKEKLVHISEMVDQFSENDFDDLFHTLREDHLGNINDWDISEGVSMLFQAVEEDIEKYIWATKGCLKNNAPHVSHPSQIIKKILEIHSFDEALIFINKYEFTNKQLWFNYLLENAKELVINKRITDEIIRNTILNKDNEHVFLLNLPLTIKFDKDAPGFALFYLELLVDYFAQRPYLLSSYLETGLHGDKDYSDEIVEFFSSDRGKIAFQKAYLLGLAGMSFFDYEQKYLLALLKEDYSFLKQVILTIIQDNQNVDNKILRALWKLENYNTIIEDTIELIGNNCQFHISANFITQYIFSSDKNGNDLDIIQETWIIEYIKRNINNIEKIKVIFDVICNFSEERKYEIIIYYCMNNNSIEAFRSISLLPSSFEWSGSMVPFIEKRIAFLEAIKNRLSGITFFDHRVYLIEMIQKLQKDKEKELLNEFLELD